MRALPLFSICLVIFLIAACGSESSSSGDMQANCLDFCEMKVLCDDSRSLGDEYSSSCSTACESGDYNNIDLELSEPLIGCGKYTECNTFNQCVVLGGSITDDEYGGYSNGPGV